MEKLKNRLMTLQSLQDDMSKTSGASIEDCDRINKNIVTIQILINETQKEIEELTTHSVREKFA